MRSGETMIYRRLIGLLLFWSVVPMPFLYVILPPFWITAAAVAILLSWKPSAAPRCSTALQFVLGIAIVITVIRVGGWNIGPIRPLGHFLLLLTSVQVLTVDDRQSFMRALPAVFLVCVASVALSTHVSLTVYLALSVAIWWWAGMRLFMLGIGFEVASSHPRPLHVMTASLVVVCLAIPIFITMPRLRSPWVTGASSRRASGFSSSVELDHSGAIEESRDLAITMTAPGGERILNLWSRLRATAFRMVFAGSWESRRSGFSATHPSNRVLWLDPDQPPLDDATRLRLEILGPDRYLFIPEGSVAVQAPVRLRRDSVGGLLIWDRIEGPLRFTVWVGDEPVGRMIPPTSGDLYLPRHNREVARLAARIAGGETSAAARAATVEAHLRTNYSYSLDVSPDDRRDPVAWFLLTGQQGHCEFFAGAMVVLLRHLDVPARLVGGYSGGALGPSGSVAVVRQANAHTWVEAWLGKSRGWVTFDPTPAEGIPALEGQSGLQRLVWAWQRVQDSWDRYVLTFGLSEQISLLGAIGDLIDWLHPRIKARHVGGAVLLVLISVGLSLLILRQHRRRATRAAPRPASAVAIGKLARKLVNAGIPVPPGATIRSIGATARERWPEAARPVDELVWLAERELYAAGWSSSGNGTAARRLWAKIVKTQRA